MSLFPRVSKECILFRTEFDNLFFSSSAEQITIVSFLISARLFIFSSSPELQFIIKRVMNSFSDSQRIRGQVLIHGEMCQCALWNEEQGLA